MIEFLKAVLFGIIQGVTEWLPISSTGHLIILNEFLSLDVSDAFMELFEVVIQLGSILAIVVLFFSKLWPFSKKQTKEEKGKIWTLWFKVAVAIIPCAIAGLLFDDWFQEKFYNFLSVAVALIVYGVAFILIERKNRTRKMICSDVYDIDWLTAFEIGCFQVLAIVPGTSRSGSTILGASLLGVERTAAAEFSFFLAIPVMVGASGFKLVKFLLDGFTVSASEVMILLVGSVVSFVVSFLAVRFLMDFVKKHSFECFGWYRIVLGVLLILGKIFIF